MDRLEKIHRTADEYSEDEILIDIIHRLSKVQQTISAYQLFQIDGSTGHNLALKKELFDEMAAAENSMAQIAYRFHGESEVEKHRDDKLDRELRRIGFEANR